MNDTPNENPRAAFEMVDDRWTDEQLQAIRKDQLKILREYRGKDSFTCDECSETNACHFAFDAYNTDGDCLGSK